MKDELSIGSTPAAESCEQVGMPSYNRAKAIAECELFAQQLRREFGEEPEGARIFVKSNSHDFGSYHEVNVRFDDDNPAAIEYAFNIEANTPEYWDATAKTLVDKMSTHGQNGHAIPGMAFSPNNVPCLLCSRR